MEKKKKKLEYLKLEPGESQLKVQKVMANRYDWSYNLDDEELTDKLRDSQKKKIGSYFISKDLVTAVNAAIVTGRPLLLKGAPGCGKTKLAEAVAAHFYREEAYRHYFEWHVKSKSKAMDGGYRFDHVSRLRDATIAQVESTAATRVQNPDHYITLGAMGHAFRADAPEGRKPILLIDEIDKGDIDFPNDLLLELDEMRFHIKERTDDYYVSAPKDKRPLVFITSNNERELPPAFLRRCLYFYIPDFGVDLLTQIASSKLEDYYDELGGENKQFLEEAPTQKFVKQFIELRDGKTGTKQPSTSEMLDWLRLITYKVVHQEQDFTELIDDKGLQNLALKLNT